MTCTFANPNNMEEKLPTTSATRRTLTATSCREEMQSMRPNRPQVSGWPVRPPVGEGGRRGHGAEYTYSAPAGADEPWPQRTTRTGPDRSNPKWCHETDRPRHETVANRFWANRLDTNQRIHRNNWKRLNCFHETAGHGSLDANQLIQRNISKRFN